ncbi:purine catabolism regulator [Arthrobacter sp. CAN_A6]|uniref:PucR family transcriptional regulator n=1 Tax=Arthrobacter sp. CAN_A6 TaxID=2787721 RepID=UPI0018C96DBF
MAIPLTSLLSAPGLNLARQGSAPLPETPIQWVAVTELEDPLPFLSGGEVVLTTGVRQKTAAAQRNFVTRVREAGALAVGFGVGLTHGRIPQAFLEQAEEEGLPIFSVPYETPFIAIGKIVADALAADTYAGLESLLRGHQVLAAALLGGGGIPALLRELAAMTGAEVALFQYGTRVAGAASPVAGSPAATIWHRVPVATGLKDRCTLAVAEPFRQAAIVDYAQSLISVELSNQARRRTSERAAAGQLLQDITRGTLDGPDAAARLASAGIDTGTRQTVVMIDVASGQQRALRTLPLPAGWESAVAAILEDRLVLLSGAADIGQLAGDLSSYLHGAGFTAQVGVGGSYAQPHGLRWSYFEAREALTHGHRINTADRLSLTSLLLASGDVPLADLAAETLDPVAAFDARHGAGLMVTLEKYLSLNGSVAAVAEDLQLHRNTVRYRLQQLIDLTGYDPGVTADRVHLYLALTVRSLR